MEKLLYNYKNGNYNVSIYSDGTKIRETSNPEDTVFTSEFPENIDLKISDKCDMGCEFCHEDSKEDGEIANFEHEFLYSLRPGTELAIGGGNIFENENLYSFLKWCKHRGIIANITVNQNHLVGEFYNSNYYLSYRVEEIFNQIDDNEVYGVGISYNGDAEELDRIFNYSVSERVPLGDHFYTHEKVSAKKYKKNCVIHVINGVHSFEDIMKLANKNYKILILGYKDIRRGINYLSEKTETIKNNQQSIYDNIHTIIKSFDIVSFDNLAIEQLNVKRLLTTDEWNEFYMGDDGQFTMYIDLVKKEFAKNSTSMKRYELMNTIDDMFNIVKNE